MTPLNPVQRAAFTVSSIAKFFAAANRAGILGTEGNPRALPTAGATLARYRFTTAREVEHGINTAPERNALIDDNGVLTYSQLAAQSKTLARRLLKIKQERGLDQLRIGVMARNGRGIILPMTAKGYAGASLYLLNVGSAREQLAGTFKETGINILVIDDEFAERIPADTENISLIWAHTSRDHGEDLSLERIILDGTDNLPKLPLFPKHGDIVLMSSGTSGIPKGVLRSEPVLPLVVGGYLSAAPWRTGMSLQITASMFHTWGWSAVNLAFATRSTVITQRIFNPENVFRQIQAFRCDGMVSSPIFFKQMLDLENNEKWDTSTLRFIASAGNALTPLLVERTIARFGPILSNYYGSTELALAACATAEMIAKKPTVAGVTPPGTVLRLYDDNGNEVPHGEVGRIFLTNETALKGYSNPTKRIESINGLVEIGDLGYFDEDGHLNVLSRNDEMIIVGGENVHPQSVTEVLERMPGIFELHSGGVDDEDTFKRVAVWVVRSDDDAGRALTADAVRNWVRDNLADHSVPRDVNFVDSLPRNATGKVMPHHLPESTRED
ncbi:AMP-binding protein [Corynebacterium mayonis]|uniref:AMP-binding protein n=1 Tax=Corynebacterium mayonis TaxID=3062461 RepID=UPI00313FFF82